MLLANTHLWMDAVASATAKAQLPVCINYRHLEWILFLLIQYSCFVDSPQLDGWLSDAGPLWGSRYCTTQENNFSGFFFKSFYFKGQHLADLCVNHLFRS